MVVIAFILQIIIIIVKVVEVSNFFVGIFMIAIGYSCRFDKSMYTYQYTFILYVFELMNYSLQI